MWVGDHQKVDSALVTCFIKGFLWSCNFNTKPGFNPNSKITFDLNAAPSQSPVFILKVQPLYQIFLHQEKKIFCAKKTFFKLLFNTVRFFLTITSTAISFLACSSDMVAL